LRRSSRRSSPCSRWIRAASRAGPPRRGRAFAVEIFGELTSQGLDLNVQSEIIRDHFAFETEARAVSLLAGDGSGSGLGAVARADLRAAKRLEDAWGEMIGKPLGLRTLPVLVAEQARVKRLGDAQVARQNAALAESARYARRAGGAGAGAPPRRDRGRPSHPRRLAPRRPPGLARGRRRNAPPRRRGRDRRPRPHDLARAGDLGEGRAETWSCDSP
jgi:hypothetical protein